MNLISLILVTLLTSAATASSLSLKNPNPAQVDGLCHFEESLREFAIHGKDPAMFYGVFAEGGVVLRKGHPDSGHGYRGIRVYAQQDRIIVQSTGADFSFTMSSLNAGTETKFSFYIQTGDTSENREWVSCRLKILKHPFNK